MVRFRRRRRRTSRFAQWRTSVIAASAVLFHVAIIFGVKPCVQLDGLHAAEAVPEEEEVYSAGGQYVVDLDCSTEVSLGAVVELALCELPLLPHSADCRSRARTRYRVGMVDCASPSEEELAQLDPVPLSETDALTIDMLQAAAAQAMEEVIEPIDPENPDGQVVEIARPAVEERPDKAEYLAEFDSRVERETFKRGIPGEQPAPPPPPPPSAPAAETAAPPSPPAASELLTGGGALDMRRPGREGQQPETEAPPDNGPSFGFQKMASEGIGSLSSTPRREETEPAGEGGGGGSGPGQIASGSASRQNFRVDRDTYERVAGGSNDYLPGVEEGEFTALNARRWKYAPFFNRVKRQVAQNWHPEEVYRLRDPNGNIYGVKDRMTVLQVSLSPDGALRKVVVSEASGVDFLDDEAVKAFEAAEPFPNPPTGLVDRDTQLITFRFGFSFEINSRTPWKVFRYNN